MKRPTLTSSQRLAWRGCIGSLAGTLLGVLLILILLATVG